MVGQRIAGPELNRNGCDEKEARDHEDVTGMTGAGLDQALDFGNIFSDGLATGAGFTKPHN